MSCLKFLDEHEKYTIVITNKHEKFHWKINTDMVWFFYKSTNMIICFVILLLIFLYTWECNTTRQKSLIIICSLVPVDYSFTSYHHIISYHSCKLFSTFCQWILLCDTVNEWIGEREKVWLITRMRRNDRTHFHFSVWIDKRNKLPHQFFMGLHTNFY